MNAITKVEHSQFVKTWLETALKVEPVSNASSVPQLFKHAPDGVRYTNKNGSILASTGEVDMAVWMKTHANEKGKVLYDFDGTTMNRVGKCIDLMLAADGLKLNTYNPTTGTGRIARAVVEELGDFKNQYDKEVVGDVKTYGSVSVRKNERAYDLVFRLMVVSEVEQLFVSIEVSNVVGQVMLNLKGTGHDVTKIGESVMGAFNYHHGLFRTMGTLSMVSILLFRAYASVLCSITGQEEVLKRDVKSYNQIWTEFREQALLNEDVLVGGDDHEPLNVEQMRYIESVTTIAKGSKEELVMDSCYNAMRTQIVQLLNYNRP